MAMISSAVKLYLVTVEKRLIGQFPVALQEMGDDLAFGLEVSYWLNQKNCRRPPTWAYRKFRKRIETIFSQLDDQFMMMRNYAKKPAGLFTRITAKITALTVLQYVNFVNHREIGHVNML